MKTATTVQELEALFIRVNSFWERTDCKAFRETTGVDPLFRIIKGEPRAYAPLPQVDGSEGHYVYHVLGWASRRPRIECERLLVQSALSTIVNIRMALIGVTGGEAIEDNSLPWIIERRPIEMIEEGPEPPHFDEVWVSGRIGYRTKLSWRICIPGVDLTKVDGYWKDGISISYVD